MKSRRVSSEGLIVLGVDRFGGGGDGGLQDLCRAVERDPVHRDNLGVCPFRHKNEIERWVRE